ncbi:nucleotide disphospho-sugar-binding domain-containing protein [Streptomyces sp. NPDC021096]|uniref:nucleotide disphospho-sugar-binding domain-containing protein n=1 Tax=Streptomyces sp. NPDC021096 TaxID=3154792 RepID=UPI003405E620
MRALFITWAWNTHFYPMVPLGQALRAAGHEVMVVSQPSFTGTITDAGLPALPVGHDIDMQGRVTAAYRNWRPRVPTHGSEGTPKGPRGRRTYQLAADCAAAMADETLAFAHSWQPDVVVYEPMALLGPLIAAHLGVPAMRLLWGMDFSRAITLLGDELFGGLAERLGVDEFAPLGGVTLDSCPPRLQVPADDVTRQPMRYVPYNGPAQLPAVLRRRPDRPRIAVTWGKTLLPIGLHDGTLGPRIVRALGRYDVDVIVATSADQRQHYTELPDNVIHVGPVPLDLLLPSCAAIVHHGGGGTTMTAMSHGVPQLVLPWIPDGVLTARQLQTTGAGRHLEPYDLDDTALTAALDAFLGDLPAYQVHADRLHRENRALPTPADVAALLAGQLGDRTGPWAQVRPQPGTSRSPARCPNMTTDRISGGTR